LNAPQWNPTSGGFAKRNSTGQGKLKAQSIKAGRLGSEKAKKLKEISSRFSVQSSKLVGECKVRSLFSGFCLPAIGSAFRRGGRGYLILDAG
jgi:hypothetical protein